VAEAEGAEAAISWDALEDKSVAFAEARERAIQNAEDDAEDLATAAWMKLRKRSSRGQAPWFASHIHITIRWASA